MIGLVVVIIVIFLMICFFFVKYPLRKSSTNKAEKGSYDSIRLNTEITLKTSDKLLLIKRKNINGNELLDVFFNGVLVSSLPYKATKDIGLIKSLRNDAEMKSKLSWTMKDARLVNDAANSIGAHVQGKEQPLDDKIPKVIPAPFVESRSKTSLEMTCNACDRPIEFCRCAD